MGASFNSGFPLVSNFQRRKGGKKGRRHFGYSNWWFGMRTASRSLCLEPLAMPFWASEPARSRCQSHGHWQPRLECCHRSLGPSRRGHGLLHCIFRESSTLPHSSMLEPNGLTYFTCISWVCPDFTRLKHIKKQFFQKQFFRKQRLRASVTRPEHPPSSGTWRGTSIDSHRKNGVAADGLRDQAHGCAVQIAVWR